MSLDNWIIGETATLPLLIVDAVGVAIDPDSIRLRIKPPGAADYAIDNPIRLDTGSFQHELALNKAGHWYYRWEVAAPQPAVAEGSIDVDPSRFAVG